MNERVLVSKRLTGLFLKILFEKHLILCFEMKNYLLLFLFNLFVLSTAYSQNSELQKQGTATQLLINKTPFLVLGGELGNSSASSSQDIEQLFPKLERMGLNTVLVPAYWDLIEPREGEFDFTLPDKVR